MLSLQRSRNRMVASAAILLCLFLGCSKPDPDSSKNSGDTRLINAIVSSDTVEAKMLLSRGTDVNAKNEMGYTALMAAAATGNGEVTKALLLRGADVTPKDKEKSRTALMWAEQCHVPHPEIAKMLRDAGAKE
jgi:ankyrin repeat protein